VISAKAGVQAIAASEGEASARQNFENPWILKKIPIRQNRARKIPFQSTRANSVRQTFPNFYFAVLSDFNELEAKIFGDAPPSIAPTSTPPCFSSLVPRCGEL
jgi:hypothetical protein